MGLFNFLTQEIAIDLGTANTLIIHNDQVVVDEPSIVAIDRTTNKIVAVGKKAMMMHEKTHENLKTIRPLKDGVIADFNAAEGMLRETFISTQLAHGYLYTIQHYRSRKTCCKRFCRTGRC
jgi:rod shape-determining protein MreB and related proteins